MPPLLDSYRSLARTVSCGHLCYKEICQCDLFSNRAGGHSLKSSNSRRQGKNSTVCHSYQVGFGKLISISSMSYGKSLCGDM